MLVQVLLVLISISILMPSEVVLISTRSYCAAGVLNPALSYTMDPTREMYRMLKDCFERMTDVESAVQALQEAEVFRMKQGEYGSQMAQRMATDPKTSSCKRSSQRNLILSATQIYYLHNPLHMQRPGG
jgi:hypothetical protein